MVESSGLELLCDEEPFLLTPAPSPVPAQRGQHLCFPEPPPLSHSNITDEERSQAFQDYILRERQYAPSVGYAKHLHRFTHLSTARTKAIRYIILVCDHIHILTVGVSSHVALLLLLSPVLSYFLRLQVCSRLGLAAGTAFNAANYLDRFLSMINCRMVRRMSYQTNSLPSNFILPIDVHNSYGMQKWEVWMTELLSVACLSIASKLDEVNIPSLHHLQVA